MTKKEIIDFCRYELKKMDFANHPMIVEGALNAVYNQILADLPARDLDYFEFHTKDYEVAVTLDATSNRYYSTLPAAIVQLKVPQRGVVAINSKQGTGFRFYPTTEKEVRQTANLESGLYDRYFGFYVHDGKVFYTNYTDELAAAGVRMSLAVQFMDFASTDEVPLPGGRDYDIAQLVIDFIRQTSVIEMQANG
jgi:hypothetical protein